MRRALASLQVCVLLISMLAAWSAPGCEEMACCKKGKMCPAHASHSPKNITQEEREKMPCAHHGKAEQASEPSKRECAMSACCNGSDEGTAVPVIGKMILARAERPERPDMSWRGLAQEEIVEASGFIVPPFEPPRS